MNTEEMYYDDVYIHAEADAKDQNLYSWRETFYWFSF